MKRRNSVLSKLISVSKAIIQYKNPNKQLMYSEMDMYSKTVIDNNKNSKKTAIPISKGKYRIKTIKTHKSEHNK